MNLFSTDEIARMRSVGSVGFMQMWRYRGRPTMQVIQPVSAWTLASGVTYDPHQDQFIDGEGGVVSVTYTTQPSITVKYLPSRQNNALTIGIPGLVTVTATEQPVILQWTSATQTAISTCWGVLMGGVLYRVKTWELFPVGASSPVEIRVSLIEANRP